MIPTDFSVYIFHDEKRIRERLLYKAASIYTGMEMAAFEKTVGEGGKPYFSGLPQVHFSISHSGDYWACAFGSEEVGLDIQHHDSCRYKNIANRFFHQEEKAYLESSDFDKEAFFELWAAKESYVKYTGRGLGADFTSFSIFNCDAELRRIPFTKDYSVCLCADKIGKTELHFMDR